MHFILPEQDSPNRTEQNLIRPFCDDKHFTAAAHFIFECKTLKVNLTVLCTTFFNFETKTVTSSSNE